MSRSNEELIFSLESTALRAQHCWVKCSGLLQAIQELSLVAVRSCEVLEHSLENLVSQCTELRRALPSPADRERLSTTSHLSGQSGTQSQTQKAPSSPQTRTEARRIAQRLKVTTLADATAVPTKARNSSR